MPQKGFVLLSGGIDSTTCLHIAMRDCDDVEAISVDYGQRHKKEFEYGNKTCKAHGIPHTLLNIGGILAGEGVMLTDKQVKIPDISYSDIKGVSPTYVPFRNGTLLAMITAYAQKWVSKQIEEVYMRRSPEGKTGFCNKEQATGLAKDVAGIYFGPHAEDAAGWAYPDCTNEFTGAMANAIYTGTYYTVRLFTPLQWLNKADIITLGTKLGVDWRNTWSCYAGEDLHCGTCPTCRARKEGFKKAGVTDPTEYAK